MEGIVFYFDFEIALMEALQAGMGPVLTALASFVTLFGEELIAVGLLAFLYWVWDKDCAIFVGTNVLIGTVINPLLKNLVLRRRPYFDNPTVRCLKPVHEGDIYDIAAQGYSFPSGHSSNSVILFGSLALHRRFVPSAGRDGALYRARHLLDGMAVLLPLLVGLSRVMLGVHYPTDVLVGWLSGLIVIVAVSPLQSRVRNREPLYLLCLLVFLPGFFYCRTNDFYTCYGMMAGFFAARILDDRVIRFENTRSLTAALLRMGVGLAGYGALNVLLKLPFSAAFLASASTPQYLVRSLRYFLITFLMLGAYPALFRKVKAFS